MRFIAMFTAVVLLVVGTSWAVSPESWRHSTEADFAEGKFDSTVVSSLAEIRLARKVNILMPTEKAGQIISAVVTVGDCIYASSGIDGTVYRIVGEKVEQAAKLPGSMITSLAVDRKCLLAGVAGQDGGIYRVGPDAEVVLIWSDPDVKYVWDILPLTGGGLLVATGPEGKVFEIERDGGKAIGHEIYSAGKLAKNILCLAMSSKTGMLYAGTDQKGLVVEINRVMGTSRIVLDAEESEVASLQTDSLGGVYAATSDAAKANGDGATKPNRIRPGKAVAGSTTQPTKEVDKSAPVKASDGAATAPAEGGSFVTVDLAEMVELMTGQDKLPPEPSEWELIDKSHTAVSGGLKDKKGGLDQASAEQPDLRARPTADLPSAKDSDKAGAEVSEAAPIAVKSRTKPVRSGKGNAVYYIRPNGLVEERFRRPVTILDMLLADGKLYLATGNGGTLYSVSVDGEEVVKLADTEAKQVTSLALVAGGEILFSTANKGSVGLLTAELSEKGSFTSEVLDASQIASWGTMRVWAELPADASATIATRSGNVSKADDDTWTSWSKELGIDGGYLAIGSKAGRFLQYRLTLVGNGKISPMVRQVRLIYQVGNLSPMIKAITVEATEKGPKSSSPSGGAKVFRQIGIESSDPNGDKLVYQVHFRQIGEGKWIRLAEDLAKAKYVWDTRTVPDGDYEIRVSASDSPANPAAQAISAGRISDPILVDNTPPIIRNLAATSANGKVTVKGAVFDMGSRIALAHYSVDSQEDWTVLSADDGIYDSDREFFSFELEHLAPGPHRLAVRAADIYGNVAYKSLAVSVGG